MDMRKRYDKWVYSSLLWLAGVSLLVTGCKEEEVIYYEGTDALYFQTATQGYSFLLTPDEEEATISLYIQLAGQVSEEERPIALEVVQNEYTNAQAGQYRIESAVMPAGENHALVKLVMKNPAKIAGAPTTLQLELQLAENKYFVPGGFINYFRTKVYWSTEAIQPRTWSSMRLFFCSTYSSNVMRAIAASCGITELWVFDVDPETGDYSHSYNQAVILGKRFGDWIREYNATHDDVYCHDDGDMKGQPVQPLS